MTPHKTGSTTTPGDSLATAPPSRCQPLPAAAHVAIASGVSQRVTSPHRTRARSYSAQFPTRYVVLYFGCTLDFTSRS